MGILTRATRNIARRKTRTALVTVVLGLSLAILITLPANISANQQASQKAIDHLNNAAESYVSWLNGVASKMEVYRPIAFDFGSEENNYTMTTILYPLMNLSDYSELNSIPNVNAVIPILRQEIKDPQNENITLYDVYGIPLGASTVDNYPSVLPSNITAGRNLRVGDRGDVVLQEIVADKLGVNVGGAVNILGYNFEVVGIQKQGEYQGLIDYNVTAAFMNLKDAQRITNTTGQATKFIVFANEADNVMVVKGRITELYSGNVTVQVAEALLLQASTARSNMAQQKIDIQNMMNQLQSTATIQIGVVIVAQATIILFIMLYTVRERTREIGTLKAMGASTITILGQFMLEGILLSILAGIAGIAIGIIGTSTIGYLLLPNLTQAGVEQVTINITPTLALFGLGAAILLGTIGNLYPAWKAATIKPAESMKYD